MTLVLDACAIMAYLRDEEGAKRTWTRISGKPLVASRQTSCGYR
jgi:hypothetical protein